MSRHPIFEQMRSDHQRVIARIAALEEAALGAAASRGPRNAREPVIREVVALLQAQFSTHMAAEDEVLFPALVESLPETRPSIEPLRADHVELRCMLDRLAGTLAKSEGSASDEDISVQVRDLIDLLRIHIRKEEAIVLSVAERVLKPREIEALGARMNARTSDGPPTDSPGGRTKGAR